MVASGGLYYLFYGAGDWDSATAAIGYARCVTPVGPCVNASTTGPWMSSHGQAVGPSRGPAVFQDSAGSLRIAYHAWSGAVGYENGGVRALWVDGLRFNFGRPVLGYASDGREDGCDRGVRPQLRASDTSSVFPTVPRASINRCAPAASSSGNRWPISGRARPLAAI